MINSELNQQQTEAEKMSEIEIKNVKLKSGWRAIIYDAPWARFKPNQKGVIISSDGRSCETTDDSKDCIIIVVDAHIGLEDRDNGHVLFKQKGSDLFDIVCLYQESGGVYELEITDRFGYTSGVTIDGCSGTYTDLRNGIVVYEVIKDKNEEIVQKTKIKEGSGYKIISPTAQFFQDTIPVDEEYSGEIVIQSVLYPEITAKTTFVLTVDRYKVLNTDESTREGSSIDLSSVKVEKNSSSDYIYSIKKTSNFTECQGGNVTFSIEKTQTSIATYKVILKNETVKITTTNVYDIKRCGVTIGKEIEVIDNDDSLTYSITGNVRILSQTDSEIILEIEDGVSSFTLTATSGFGLTKSRTFNRNSDSNFV